MLEKVIVSGIETALVRKNDLLLVVDKSGSSTLLLLDLSAAFDTVDLLQRFTTWVGSKWSGCWSFTILSLTYSLLWSETPYLLFPISVMGFLKGQSWGSHFLFLWYQHFYIKDLPTPSELGHHHRSAGSGQISHLKPLCFCRTYQLQFFLKTLISVNSNWFYLVTFYCCCIDSCFILSFLWST